MKTCTKCGQTKRVSEFYRKGKYWQSCCKQCQKRKSAAWAKTHHEKVLESNRRYRLKHAEEGRERSKWYRLQHPEKVRESQKRYGQRHPEKRDEHRARQFLSRGTAIPPKKWPQILVETLIINRKIKRLCQNQKTSPN